MERAFEVLDFWWSAGPGKWFTRSDEFDARIKDRFFPLYEEAAAGGLDAWRASPHGMLALIVLLDQFPRNMFRDDPRTFATDPQALVLAEEAIARGFDKAFPMPARSFFYMPLMHAEDMEAQERCCDLFRVSGDREGYFYALVHLDAIRRFGRFPHRNVVLGRETSEAERRYLETGGFAN